MADVSDRSFELWMGSSNRAGKAVEMARRAEAQGFDGVSFGDTQCQNPDAFIGITVAAAATEHLKLGIGVTNPVTRHPAVLACAISTVQHYAGGRVVLGVGRGDSAVTKLGLPAATVPELERFLVRLQRYLAGERVEEEGPLAQLTWIEQLSVPKVPVDVAASGPAVISVGARLAERVTFSVGADPHRVGRAVDLARRVRESAGLDPAGVSLGALVHVAPYPDHRVALELIKPVSAVHARFSLTAGELADQIDPHDASVIRAVVEHYDMSRHGRGGASHLDYVDEAFLDRFGVAGTPEDCIERLAALASFGLDRLSIIGPSPDVSTDAAEESTRLLTEVVFPGVRRAVARQRGRR